MGYIPKGGTNEIYSCCLICSSRFIDRWTKLSSASWFWVRVEPEETVHWNLQFHWVFDTCPEMTMPLDLETWRPEASRQIWTPTKSFLESGCGDTKKQSLGPNALVQHFSRTLIALTFCQKMFKILGQIQTHKQLTTCVSIPNVWKKCCAKWHFCAALFNPFDKHLTSGHLPEVATWGTLRNQTCHKCSPCPGIQGSLDVLFSAVNSSWL